MARTKVSKEEWDKKLEEVPLDKIELNRLVMDFLVLEGYKDAAEKFAEESGTDPLVNLNEIEERMKVRAAIQNGNIEEGIRVVNDINPEILDKDPGLMFAIKQQQLIELIRQGEVEKALSFAQHEIAPRGEERMEYLPEIERTLSLLAFNEPQQARSPVGDLLSHAQRQKTASTINAAILDSQCQEKEPLLPTILKLLLWSQDQLAQKMDYPQVTLSGRYKGEDKSS